MGYTREIVASLKAQIDIGDLIGRFVELKQKGSNLKGFCPFHNENTPSFTVTPAKGIYKCFGCSASGDHIEFLQQHEHLSFIESIQWLSREYNVPLPEKEIEKARRPHYEKRALKKDEKQGDYWFDYEDLNDDDIRVWFAANVIKYRQKEGGIKKLYEVLERYNWKKVKSYTVCYETEAVTKTANENYPIYARTEKWTLGDSRGEFTKVYQPYHFDKGKKFTYLGEKPRIYVNGLAQATIAQLEYKILQEAENEESETEELDSESKKHLLPEILLTSGERDSMNAAAIGYWPIWMNSESDIIPPAVLTNVMKICKVLVNIPDIDDTGIAQMHKLCMNPESNRYLEIKNVILPAELKKKWSNGKPCKDLRDYLNHFSVFSFHELVKTAFPYKFWDYIVNEYKGKVSTRWEINNEYLNFFLERNGFLLYQITPDGNDVPQMRLIHINNKVVRFVTESQIKKWVINFMRERSLPVALRNAAHRTAYFGAKYLDSLSDFAPDFKAYAKDFQCLFFQNKVWKISADDIKEISTDKNDIGKFVWADKLIPHVVSVAKKPPFEITWSEEDGFDIVINDFESPFMKYLIATSAIHWRIREDGIEEVQEDGTKLIRKALTDDEAKEERLHLINKLFAIGYVSHRQKLKYRPWFVYGMENKITGEGKSKGGTGKTAFFDAFRYYMRVVTVSGGRDLGDEKFKWGAVTKDTDFTYMDDIHEYFDWGSIYQHTTDGFPVNPKNSPGFTIPFQDSPKMGGSGNFAVRDNEGSTIRRIIFVAFSDYFHSANAQAGIKERNIKDLIGKELYLDFNREDWNAFYNVIARCIQFYLWNPTDKIVNPPMTDVIYKNIRGAIGESFFDWAEKVFIPELQNTDVLLIRENVQDHYTETLKKRNMAKATPTPQLFKEKLEKFCFLMNWKLNPDDHPLMAKAKPGQKTTQRIQKWVAADGRPREMFYIQTRDEAGNLIPFNNQDIKIDLDKPINLNAQQANLNPENKDEMPF